MMFLNNFIINTHKSLDIFLIYCHFLDFFVLILTYPSSKQKTKKSHNELFLFCSVSLMISSNPIRSKEKSIYKFPKASNTDDQSFLIYQCNTNLNFYLPSNLNRDKQKILQSKTTVRTMPPCLKQRKLWSPVSETLLNWYLIFTLIYFYEWASYI